MARTVTEWWGKTDDSRPPPRVMVRIFNRFSGACYCCGVKIFGKPWQADHIIALINGGENRESNMAPILVACHKEKTARDVAEKSKVYRIRRKHLGIKPKSRWGIPGMRKKINGQVVPR